jgi:chemotaxis signal transduction protein
MNPIVPKPDGKVAEMRRLFDGSFAAAPPARPAEPQAMLAIRVEGEYFALRVQEISGLAVSSEKLVSVPSRVPELMGLTGIRGVVVPVFSLARLIGFHSEHASTRWLVFCGDSQAPIALAFERMERLFEVSTSEIFAREQHPGRGYVNETVSEGATLRGVIDILALVENIKSRTPANAGTER